MVTKTDIINRLKQLGYTATEGDNDHIEFELGKVHHYVMNFCNIKTVPEILNYRIIDQVCAQFLFTKKNSGQLDGFNYDVVIKSIKEGDTTVTYGVGNEGNTPESRFDSFVKELTRHFDKVLAPHRSLRW